jgi:hypothetical protein
VFFLTSGVGFLIGVSDLEKYKYIQDNASDKTYFYDLDNMGQVMIQNNVLMFTQTTLFQANQEKKEKVYSKYER